MSNIISDHFFKLASDPTVNSRSEPGLKKWDKVRQNKMKMDYQNIIQNHIYLEQQRDQISDGKLTYTFGQPTNQ